MPALPEDADRHDAGAADRAASERLEDARPIAIPVRSGLYLGNAAAADDGETLARLGITQTLNLAVNIDPLPLTLADGTAIRRAKIGLIDGAGNHPVHLVAAVLTIEGMLAQASPGKPSYPDHRPGALLVHCRGGRSRSVTALALWLARSEPQTWPTERDAVEALRQLRGLPPEQPNAEMLDAMQAAARILTAVPFLRRVPDGPPPDKRSSLTQASEPDGGRG